jgi:mannopine transport system ATP-binding protein
MQIFDATKMKYESSAKLLSHQRVLAAFLIIVTGAACQVGADFYIAVDLPWLRLRVARWDCWYGAAVKRALERLDATERHRNS